MRSAEAKGGSLQDVANVVMANRIILSLFAPNFEGPLAGCLVRIVGLVFPLIAAAVILLVLLFGGFIVN